MALGFFAGPEALQPQSGETHLGGTFGVQVNRSLSVELQALSGDDRTTSGLFAGLHYPLAKRLDFELYVGTERQQPDASADPTRNGGIWGLGLAWMPLSMRIRLRYSDHSIGGGTTGMSLLFHF